MAFFYHIFLSAPNKPTKKVKLYNLKDEPL